MSYATALALLLTLLPSMIIADTLGAEGSSSSPDTFWGVQIVANRPSSLEVISAQLTRKSLLRSLEEEGVGSVSEVILDKGAIGTLSCVIVGRYEYMPDATIARNRLRANGYEGAFLVELPSGNREKLVSEVTRPSSWISGARGEVRVTKREFSDPLIDERLRALEGFLPGSHDEAAPLLAKSDSSWGIAVEARLNRLLAKNEFLELGRSLEVTFPICRSTEPERVALIEENQIRKLKAVALDDTPGTEYERVEAAFAIGQIYQEYLSDRLTAYEVYSDVLRAFPDDVSVQIRARTMRAAALFELARSQGATFPEVRRECSKILALYPSEYQNAKATAELMYWETYYFEHLASSASDRSEVMHLVEEKLSNLHTKYPSCAREIVLANLYAARGAIENNRLLNAAEYLQRNLSIRIPEQSTPSWAGIPWDLTSHSRLLLAQVLQDLGVDDSEYSFLFKHSFEEKVPQIPFYQERFAVREGEIE